MAFVVLLVFVCVVGIGVGARLIAYPPWRDDARLVSPGVRRLAGIGWLTAGIVALVLAWSLWDSGVI